MGRLEGKVALVTGAGAGIGRATARRFAEEGACVFAVSRTFANVQATAELAGPNCRALTMDVVDSASIARGIDTIVDERGRIDIVVNNAGATAQGTVATLAESDWDAAIDVNLKSVYLVSKAAWPHLVTAGGGAILSTASIHGFWPLAGNAAYCASKGGVINLTKAMALEGAPDRIRANCVCPGYVLTEMLAGYFESQADGATVKANAERMHPIGRLGDPVDVANAFVYLGSDEASWVTGTSLTIDGGATIGLT